MPAFAWRARAIMALNCEHDAEAFHAKKRDRQQRRNRAHL